MKFLFILFLFFFCSINSQLAGGWSEVQDFDEPINIAYEFGLSEVSKQANVRFQIVEVIKVYRQVVAGTNYKFQIKGTDVYGNEQEHEFVVFRDLKGNHALTQHAQKRS
ncbi:cystatin [Anaeramoeba ignava]|uniref:Cystatin n=1 Tax=Anaeramoeba ignava TaxID=1746090 RepID=A0A9Q0LKX9_ANAIG|nr:cystatin [Anaeramoeba ignava]